MPRSGRKPEGERGPVPELAFDGEVASQESGDTAADGKADAGAMLGFRIEAREFVEDVLVLVLRNSGAGVDDSYRDPRARPESAGPLQSSVDRNTSGRRVFQSVGEQIGQHLPCPHLIGHGLQAIGYADVKGESSRRCLRAKVLRDFASQLAHIRLYALYIDLSRLRARKLHQLVD